MICLQTHREVRADAPGLPEESSSGDLQYPHGDGSGKGVPAALFMVIAKTLIKNRAQMGGGPAEVLQYANEQLCEGNDAELFVNIAHYAYAPDQGSATIRVQPDEKSHTVAITFIDSGIPYDPLAKPDPDVTLSAEDRQIGGLGIYMVKRSMDDMRYEYRNGQNVLTIIKNTK